MHKEPTETYFTILIIALALLLLIFIFSITLLIQYKKNKSLYLEKINAGYISREEERKRISRDLHDEFATILSALKLYISVFRESDKVDNSLLSKMDLSVNDALSSIHNITNNLFPSALEKNDLTASLNDFVEHINELNKLDIKFTYTNANIDKDVKQEYKIHIYRLLHEIIQNTINHSGSNKLLINFNKKNMKLIIKTIDFGKGMDLQLTINSTKGSGLKNIADRVALMKGEVFIETSLGKGLEYIIEIPIDNEN